jgi:hypothetical protein
MRGEVGHGAGCAIERVQKASPIVTPAQAEVQGFERIWIPAKNMRE